MGGLSHSPARKPEGSGNLPVDKVDLIPSLERVFALAGKYPGKTLLLDAKPGSAVNRMAKQLIDLLRKYPDMRERVIVSSPDPETLAKFQSAFASQPDFKDFKNFTLDKETLNKRNPSKQDKDPLSGSGDNRFASIGVPKSPLAGADFYDAVKAVRKARKTIDAPGSAHKGKKLVTWTVNEKEHLRKMFRAKPHMVITAEPRLANRVLTEMGYRVGDPTRPRVLAHRGGGNLERHPENSLAAVEYGMQVADGVELDLVSTKDDLLLYHDQNPNDLISVARNLGVEADHTWRPAFPYLNSCYRRPLAELTSAEVREHYGYTRNRSSSIGLNLALNIAGQLLQAPLLLLPQR